MHDFQLEDYVLVWAITAEGSQRENDGNKCKNVAFFPVTMDWTS